MEEVRQFVGKQNEKLNQYKRKNDHADYLLHIHDVKLQREKLQQRVTALVEQEPQNPSFS